MKKKKRSAGLQGRNALARIVLVLPLSDASLSYSFAQEESSRSSEKRHFQNHNDTLKHTHVYKARRSIRRHKRAK